MEEFYRELKEFEEDFVESGNDLSKSFIDFFNKAVKYSFMDLRSTRNFSDFCVYRQKLKNKSERLLDTNNNKRLFTDLLDIVNRAIENYKLNNE